MKAILLAGGRATRLAPWSLYFNKHTALVGDKPMLYYPLRTLKTIGVTHTVIVLGDTQTGDIVKMLEDGSLFNMTISYVYQSKPEGIAHAMYLAAHHVIGEGVFVVILGDNYFSEISGVHAQWVNNMPLEHAGIFTYGKIGNLEKQRFGCAFVQNIPKHTIVDIVEKPSLKDIESFSGEVKAITGLYVLTDEFIYLFKKLKKSNRGEYEITDILKMYLDRKRLLNFNHDGLWSDMGTFESIQKVSHWVLKEMKE